MPAGSEGPRPERPAPVELPELPHVWRPIGPMVAAIAGILAVSAVSAVLWFTFDQQTRDSVTPFQRSTVVALMLLGFGVLFGIGRSRVEAHADRLTVINGFRRHDLEWAEVIGVHLRPGAPWVTLDLASGNPLSAMGIQSSDGGRARVAARQLRALVDAQAARAEQARLDGPGDTGDTGDTEEPGAPTG